ncbi:MAG: TetR/AcrR family transcriptional regulator, partial [Pedobacter sp.]|nr:TetR/AcrR family transcriptional regulator [Pedobacter sp.]
MAQLQAFDLEPRKLPAQQRSQATFDAVVESCARLLPELGYAGITTNHIAETAGVGVASLYEYFPGKDAVIAQVAERLVQRVMTRLGVAMTAILKAEPQARPMRIWMQAIYDTLQKEKKLVAIFVYQIPYTNQLPVIKGLRPLLMQFSQTARQDAGARILVSPSQASLLLINNLVSSTLL